MNPPLSPLPPVTFDSPFILSLVLLRALHVVISSLPGLPEPREASQAPLPRSALRRLRHLGQQRVRLGGAHGRRGIGRIPGKDTRKVLRSESNIDPHSGMLNYENGAEHAVWPNMGL